MTMLIAILSWVTILFANAHFAQVSRFSKEFGATVVALSIFCPSMAKRQICLRRLKNDFNRRFRARRDARRLGRALLNRRLTEMNSPSSMTSV